MIHGRDHQERQLRTKPRRNKRPEEEAPEAERKRGAPRQGLMGPETGRFESPRGPAKGGSEVAPTKKAERREEVRHQEERMIGRRAAGVGGNVRDQRSQGVSRDKLERAARMADRATTKRPSR